MYTHTQIHTHTGTHTHTQTHTHRHTQDTRQKKWLHRTRTSRSHEPLTTMSPRPSMHQTPSWCPRSVHSRCSQKRKGRGAWTKASIQMYTHTQTQTGTDRQTDRQTQTKTQIHTDRHRHTHSLTHTGDNGNSVVPRACSCPRLSGCICCLQTQVVCRPG